MAELTPMMRQYMEIKEQNPDSILFFRLGDFYEMFGPDARTASRELDLALTTRDKDKTKSFDDKIPMCGIPYHASDAYIARLIAKGYKVAICEQTEDPAAAKGLVKRDIIRVVTPGTVIDESDLIPQRERGGEYLMLRLRTTRGIEEWEYRGTYFMDFAPLEARLEQFCDKGWAERTAEGRWRFTPKGFLVSNQLIGDLLDRQEQAYTELFLGKRVTTTSVERITVVPDAGKQKYILCRFSPDRGLLPGNDLTGDVVLLQLDKESDGSFTLTPASPKAARTATYRVAADVVCTVYCGTEELTRATLPLFEFGRDVELALPSKK